MNGKPGCSKGELPLSGEMIELSAQGIPVCGEKHVSPKPNSILGQSVVKN